MDLNLGREVRRLAMRPCPDRSESHSCRLATRLEELGRELPTREALEADLAPDSDWPGLEKDPDAVAEAARAVERRAREAERRRVEAERARELRARELDRLREAEEAARVARRQREREEEELLAQRSREERERLEMVASCVGEPVLVYPCSGAVWMYKESSV